MIQNPILRGFCPDPSIIRVGEDYYIATSTFEWWPGVKLFHSKDLKHWEQIASPLRRRSQLDMAGNPPSGGIWAPCLSYDGQYFYLVYTDVKTKKGRYYNTHNYVVYTEDIRGEWSEPVYLNSIGFDPSLFHDTDGKKYLINMINKFKGIVVQELEAKTLRPIGERKLVYGGSEIGKTEGPHMYHIGDWYYLIVAEGGTGYTHCVTMARSKSIWGPFETAPDNPILTSNREDIYALQKCGHADIVDTPEGEWYMVHLCSRPLNGKRWCTLGRETAIQKMKWQDGWLRLAEGGRFAATYVPEPGEMPESRLQDGAETGTDSAVLKENQPDEKVEIGINVFDLHEHFDSAELPIGFVSPRVSCDHAVDLESRPGWLRLKGQESMNSLHRVSLLAVRQQEAQAYAATIMDFKPDYTEQLAGLTYMYDALNFYLLGITAAEEGSRVLTVLKSDQGEITDEIEPIPVPEDCDVQMKAVITDGGEALEFFYCFTKAADYEEKWISIGKKFTTEMITDEYCRGFTGAHFGLYAHDMTGLGYCAAFDRFDVVYDRG
ncbi:MAG: glycoside hydrolase family 43 protein [Lachnospiraceae bacterium]|nr:glycoside hydrolase family 43 protein [Lachnospiraceae bacterium]